VLILKCAGCPKDRIANATGSVGTDETTATQSAFFELTRELYLPELESSSNDAESHAATLVKP
jgi:hypothetical protein